MVWKCSTHGIDQKFGNVLVGKLEGKRPLGRLRHRWEDNIIIDLGKQCGKMWTGSIWLRIGTSSGLLLTR
jgi:hypothetical protein